MRKKRTKKPTPRSKEVVISWTTADFGEKEKKVVTVRTKKCALRLLRRYAAKALDKAVNGIHTAPFEVLEVNWTDRTIKKRLFGT